jgi:2-polyprenyl-6-methoxyphenol hydroxylase-like FAD-dependent oxidoreductase
MFLALLLARQGIDVCLLEAHHDFDRDFRGDTIHPSTLEALDRMGLADELHCLPHTKLREARITTPEGTQTLASFARLPTRFPYIMLMPQARFLDFLAEHGRQYPNLRLMMGAQVTDLIREDGEVRGVVYTQYAVERQLRALVTVGADGRFSKLRKLAGLEPVRNAPPMDVVWLRLPRHASDQHDFSFMVNAGRFAVLFEREAEWQVGYVIPKGGFQQLKTAGIEALRRELAALVPWLADRVHLLTDWRQMTLLAVESSRLRRWYQPGLLLIGDAAHVMSPVGGVGISYAIQDGVAAANLLAEPIRAGRVRVEHLAAVQRRREWPVAVIQLFQRFMQNTLVTTAIDRTRPFRMPLPARILFRVPFLRDLPARLIGLGLWRERPRL